MDKKETLKLLAQIQSLFAPTQQVASPEFVAEAWHEVLAEFDYPIAHRAILALAKTDSREYGGFPSVALVVNAIKKEQGRINGIFNKAFYNVPYSDIEYKDLITEQEYNYLLSKDEETLLANREKLISHLWDKTKQIESEGTE